MIFLKLGGSLLTEKTGIESIRPDVLHRVAQEIATARAKSPAMKMVIGHGGGSFGHVPARRHKTRQGVKTADQWLGFAEVHAAMNRLNRHMTDLFLTAELPTFPLQPSAIVQCAAGKITALDSSSIQKALNCGLIPMVYGDVAFDAETGGTILSTEQIFAALADQLHPSWLLLAGETAGVYDGSGRIIPLIDKSNYGQIAPSLGESRGTDVTGGMAAKVKDMLALTREHPQLRVRIFSGLKPDLLTEILLDPALRTGTLIKW